MRGFLDRLAEGLFAAPLEGAGMGLHLKVVLGAIAVICAAFSSVLYVQVIRGHSPPLILPVSLTLVSIVLTVVGFGSSIVTQIREAFRREHKTPR
jgi:hypothetical protein